ncbi:MAG TPA: nitronate monooxygenase [Polyangiaceae bacterium]|nr:nitronate monooxygenase [Polyangiaceae bacterium]
MKALRTPLCDLLGIDVPIIQSGMGGVAGPELAAEVCRAGGLGILAGLNVPADVLRRNIARLRELSSRPFGVNLWLHEAMQPPVDVRTLSESDVRGAQTELNRFRAALGVEPKSGGPEPIPDLIDAQIDVIIEERVPVLSVGLGDPRQDRVARCRERGIRVMAMATTVGDALVLEASGVDVIVAQGGEAGGHRSTWVKPCSASAASVGTMTLVPEIVDAVHVPVVAAGGVADGRGLVAALALGAQGILLGTRFVATRESKAAPFFKQAIVAGTADSTRVTDVFTGLYARGIDNEFIRGYERSGAPVLPPLAQRNLAQDVYAAAALKGDQEHFPMLAGQSLGLIHALPGAADVVRAIVEEAERVRKRIAG